MNGARLMLELRLIVRRYGAVPLLALLLLTFAIAGWSWLLPARRAQQSLAVRPVPAASSAPLTPAPSADQNLAAFYAALGEERYAEQQVRTIFALAGRGGVTLSSGQYKAAYDENGRFSSYQITLPVKGSYPMVWQFAMQVLASVPFASLDDMSFRRENAGDQNVEARLRFTLYLKGEPQ